MVLARPTEVGALRYVKTIASKWCVGANLVVNVFFASIYIIMFFL